LLVDSHCHLQDPKFDGEHEAVVRRSREAGVSALVIVGYDLESSRRAVEMADSFENTYATVGVHPHDAKTLTPADIDPLARLAENPCVVAIGEIGLDFYRNLSPPARQRDAFREQLHLARSLQLPVVVHARDADEETFEILADHGRRVPPLSLEDCPLGVMHCFAGDLTLALRYIEIGFLISIAGPVTYPNAEKTREVARGIPLSSMVLETDAPYLTPQSRRGQRNEPAYIAETVEQIAGLRGEPLSLVANSTAVAAARLFGLENITEPAVRAAGERP
jgi:TatD DNase family protein